MVEQVAETLIGTVGVILAYLGIGIGLVCTGWSTRNQGRGIPIFMMVAGFVFISISVFLRVSLSLIS